MKSLNHPIALRMKTSWPDAGDSEDRATLRPDREGELSTSIGGQETWDSKPRNPGGDEGSSTRFCCDGGERNGLRPPQGPVYHGEDEAETLA